MRKGKRTFASRKRKIAGLLAFVLAGVIGVGAYAFTASNTVEAQVAGSGAGAVTGFAITGVEPAIGATGDVTSVVFKIAPNPTEAIAAYSETAGAKETWTKPCVEVVEEEWKCEYTTPLTAIEFNKDVEFYVTASIKK